jgi:hypothetical protein
MASTSGGGAGAGAGGESCSAKGAPTSSFALAESLRQRLKQVEAELKEANDPGLKAAYIHRQTELERQLFVIDQQFQQPAGMPMPLPAPLLFPVDSPLISSCFCLDCPPRCVVISLFCA